MNAKADGMVRFALALQVKRYSKLPVYESGGGGGGGGVKGELEGVRGS